MPPKAPKRVLSHFSVEEKLLAIHRVNDGESKASVARDIGVAESTLRGWCKSEAKLRSSCENERNPLPAEGCLDLAAKRPRLAEPQQPRLSEEAEQITRSYVARLEALQEQYRRQWLVFTELVAMAIQH